LDNGFLGYWIGSYLVIGFKLDQRSGYSAERNNIIALNPQDLVNGLAGFKENT
jgi:hypothetical protein